MPKIRTYAKKIIGIFSVVRGYNILLLCLAEYFGACFILSRQQTIEVLKDTQLLAIVLAGAFAVAGGYIVNAFYDQEKDLINKPSRVMIEHFVGQNTKLTLYFILNFLSIFAASYVSFKSVLFFSAYIFGLWLYSHKLKRIFWLSNLFSAVLAVAPFFAIFLYYQNYEKVVFGHAIFLFLLILLRDFLKDLQNLRGDFSSGYATFVVHFGEKITKIVMSLCLIFILITATYLALQPSVGLMKYYFWGAEGFLLLFLFFLWKARYAKDYAILHFLLKIVIALGVFSIILIKY